MEDSKESMFAQDRNKDFADTVLEKYRRWLKHNKLSKYDSMYNQYVTVNKAFCDYMGELILAIIEKETQG